MFSNSVGNVKTLFARVFKSVVEGGMKSFACIMIPFLSIESGGMQSKSALYN